MDITDLILSDHHEQRRMFALLDGADDDPAQLAPIWARLAILLEVHASAEEALFYPRLLKIGEGASDEDSPADETKDAIHDHNEIRDAVEDAAGHDVGSRMWWESVVAARVANSDHMAEEERQALADFRRTASLQVRHDLGVAFAAYEAAHAGGIDSADKDPDDYVDRHAT
jgi:hypothetical protein